MFQYIADLITYDLFKLEVETNFASSVDFFIYDVLKILFLIFIVVSVIAFKRTFGNCSACGCKAEL